MLLLAHINGFMVSDASITYDGDGTFNILFMPWLMSHVFGQSV